MFAGLSPGAKAQVEAQPLGGSHTPRAVPVGLTLLHGAAPGLLSLRALDTIQDVEHHSARCQSRGPRHDQSLRQPAPSAKKRALSRSTPRRRFLQSAGPARHGQHGAMDRHSDLGPATDSNLGPVTPTRTPTATPCSTCRSARPTVSATGARAAGPTTPARSAAREGIFSSAISDALDLEVAGPTGPDSPARHDSPCGDPGRR
jgi:hypothetical protein